MCQKRPVRPFQSIIGVTPDEWQETFQFFSSKQLLAHQRCQGFTLELQRCRIWEQQKLFSLPMSAYLTFLGHLFQLSCWPDPISSKDGWNNPLDKSLNHVNWDRDSHCWEKNSYLYKKYDHFSCVFEIDNQPLARHSLYLISWVNKWQRVLFLKREKSQFLHISKVFM